MCCFLSHPEIRINLVTTTKYTAFGVIDIWVFVKDFAVDCRADDARVIFAKYGRSDYEASQGRLCCWTIVFLRFQVVDKITPIRYSHFPSPLVVSFATHTTGFYKNSRL